MGNWRSLDERTVWIRDHGARSMDGDRRIRGGDTRIRGIATGRHLAADPTGGRCTRDEDQTE